MKNIKVHIGIHLSDAIPIQNGQKQEMLYHHYFSTLLSNIPSGRSKKTKRYWNEWGTLACGR
jgi:hypothetical protein